MAEARWGVVRRARSHSVGVVLGMGGSGDVPPWSTASNMGPPHVVSDGISEKVEAFEQAAVGGLRAGQGVAAFAGDGDEALGAAAALGGGAAVAEGDQALVFHAVQRGIERAGGGVAAGLSGNLAEDGDAVGLVAKTQDGEENDLFEFAERAVGIHMDYNVGLNEKGVNKIL